MLETPGVVMKNGQAYGERMTSHSWSFRYRQAVARVGETIFDLDGVYDGLIYRNGKPYIRFRADHVTANTVTRNFAVKGAFHVDMLGDGPKRSLDTIDASGAEIVSFELHKPTLDDVFLHLTGHRTAKEEPKL